MSDNFRTVTNTSWFGRMGNSIKGIFIGIILVIAASILLFWNEGRAVRRYQVLKEGAEKVISVLKEKALPENEGKLVHVSGEISTNGVIYDNEFGLKVPAIKLKRTVEMYQWEESSTTKTRTKIGGGEEKITDYSYKQVWSESMIDSSKFHSSEHKNPNNMKYKSDIFLAENYNLGGFGVSNLFINKLENYTSLKEDIGVFIKDGRKNGNDIYIGAEPSNPKLGDLRIRFSAVYPNTYSVIGKQNQGTLESYKMKKGEISLIEEGFKTSGDMFNTAQESNKNLTLILRIVGFILMIFGFLSMLSIFSVAGSIIPFVGRIIGGGTFVISLVLSASLSGIIIAVAWISYRPLIGIGILALVAVILFLAKKKR